MKNSVLLGLFGNSAKPAADMLSDLIPALKPAKISRAVASEKKGTAQKTTQWISDNDLITFVESVEADHPVRQRLDAMVELLALLSYSQEPTAVPDSKVIATPTSHTPTQGEHVYKTSEMNTKKETPAKKGIDLGIGETTDNPFAFGAVTAKRKTKADKLVFGTEPVTFGVPADDSPFDINQPTPPFSSNNAGIKS